MFRLDTVAREREKVWEGQWTETQRDNPDLTELSERQLQTNNRLTNFFQNSLNFIYQDIVSVMSFNESILLTFGLPVLVADARTWTSPIWRIFSLKDFT